MKTPAVCVLSIATVVAMIAVVEFHPAKATPPVGTPQMQENTIKWETSGLACQSSNMLAETCFDRGQLFESTKNMVFDLRTNNADSDARADAVLEIDYDLGLLGATPESIGTTREELKSWLMAGK